MYKPYFKPTGDLDGEIADIWTQEQMAEWREQLEQILAVNPGIMHYMVRDNVSACMMGGDRTKIEIWGHHLFTDKSLVGCQYCLEWLHA